MESIKNVIAILSSLGLFMNAVLFIPQSIKIYKEKDSRDVSLVTFCGFFMIMIVLVLHGIIIGDWILAVGYSLSMLTCGAVILLTIIYRNSAQKQQTKSN